VVLMDVEVVYGLMDDRVQESISRAKVPTGSL
jgi:hypothetical protein